MKKHKIFAILALFLIFSITSCSVFNQVLESALQNTLTALETSTNTPEPEDISTLTPTATETPTQTATSTDTPTDTPTLTPTTYPLSLDSILEEIAIQEQDLIKFYQEIDVPTDGFVDGSIMVISPLKFSSDSYATWASLNRDIWESEIPSDVMKFHWTGFSTERDFQDGRIPLYLATHTSLILVFNSPDEAHQFFKADTSDMAKAFQLNMQTIGDESIAFRGWMGGYAPVGGVIWRYQEVYCAFMTQLKFEVAPESLITISLNIQERLAEALK